MFTFRRAFGLIAPIFALGLGGACSAGKHDPVNLQPDESGGTGGSGASGGAGGSTTGAGGSTGGSISLTGGSSSGGGSGMSGSGGTTMITACAGDVEMGKPVPVDVYVMLDISGSMLDPSGSSGQTKWDAVKSALNAFFSDAASAGLSVAIQYFPLRTPGTPTSCTSDTDCGSAGPCMLNVCQQTPGVLVACTPSADPSDLAPCTNVVQSDDGPCMNSVCHLSGKACTSNTDCQTTQAALGKCLQFGACAGDPTLSCGISNPGHDQPGCGANNTAGMCVAVTSSFCVHETQCDPDAYATPAVDFLTLPDTAMTLNNSIAAQMPAGDTPSRQALLGAIAHARAHAKDNVGHSVVIVLATDGLPTDCTGGREVSGESAAALQDVIAVTSAGFTPKTATDASIQTFVIGVFAEAEKASAQTNLDQIAKAGGTEQSFVISSADSDVQQKFLSALNDIRKARLSCEFQIPQPAAGAQLNYKEVNVELTTGVSSGNAGSGNMNAAGSGATGGTQTELYYVKPDGCTGAPDEWHYDQEDPKPTKIVACPKTCDALKVATDAQISVKLGCMQHVR